MKKQDFKFVAFIGGLCSVLAALTDYSTKKEWQEVHTNAVAVGGIAMMGGAFA